ncbi:MAG: S8 family serine peptidase [Lewinellaceae bacterium]|nr:S8 family serine peptidase [Lewinellaceae bacterium]
MVTLFWILCFVTLFTWRITPPYRQRHHQMRYTFFGSLILWLIGLMGQWFESPELFHPGRTILLLLSLGIGSQLFYLWRKLRYTKWLVPIGMCLLAWVLQDRKLPRLDPKGELLVQISDDMNPETIKSRLGFNLASITPAFEVTDSESPLAHYYKINLHYLPWQSTHSLQHRLQRISGVQWIDQNEYYAFFKPMTGHSEIQPSMQWSNDPLLARQWHLDQQQIGDLQASLQSAHPGKSARLFILDTGVDSKHEDLSPNYTSWRKEDESDDQGHGTHCAGVAAAVTNNQTGGASMDPGPSFFTVTSIKVLNFFGGGTQQTIIQGMIDAANQGADVISMSLGGRSSDEKQRLYEEAVKYANKKGTIVVVAAGNDGGSATLVTPANVPGVITVTAIQSDLTKPAFANTLEGIQFGLAAPGVDILAPIPKNKYANYSGTSMATPQVAGVIALMKSLEPDLTTKDAFELLQETGLSTPQSTKNGTLIQPNKAIASLMATIPAVQ